MRRWHWLGLSLLALGCCESDAERVEARRFLALYEGLDHHDPVAVREAKLKDLSALPLSQEGIKKARDACVEAHHSLIRAETVQESAAAALDRAIANQPAGEPLPAAESAKIGAELRQAQAALTSARGQFVPCENAARALALRFGDR